MFVPGTVPRLANRVLQVTKNEAENSEDPRYIATLNIAADKLQTREIAFLKYCNFHEKKRRGYYITFGYPIKHYSCFLHPKTKYMLAKTL